MTKPAGRRFSAILILLVIPLISISALDLSGQRVSVSAGVTLDIAPFGLEQVYYTFQAEYILPGTITAGIRPAFSFNESSYMFRIPLVGSLQVFERSDEFFRLSGYAGLGPEFYKSAEHETLSLLLTGGLSGEIGHFYFDLPFASAFRGFNTDSDLSATAGVSFTF